MGVEAHTDAPTCMSVKRTPSWASASRFGVIPAAAGQFGNVLLGFALTEAIALFALVIAFLILFG